MSDRLTCTVCPASHSTPLPGVETYIVAFAVYMYTIMRYMHIVTLAVFGTAFFGFTNEILPAEKHCTGSCIGGDPKSVMSIKNLMKIKEDERDACRLEGMCPRKNLQPLSNLACDGGKAGEFECKGVDLLSFVPLDHLGSKGEGNDIWGWTDATVETLTSRTW